MLTALRDWEKSEMTDMKIICVGDLCCDLIVPYGKMQDALARGDISKETTDPVL